LLFAPGSEPRKLERARDSAADLVVLDLEDAVAPAEKARAREQVCEQLRAHRERGTQQGERGPELAVRVNPSGSPEFEADLERSIAAGARAIMLPKAECPEQLARAASRVARLEAELELPDGSVRLLALVETAAGIARVEALAERPELRELRGTDARIDALCFGNADFSLDLGLVDADTASGVVLHARCRLAIAAAAAKSVPIDGVCLAVRDPAAFTREAELALRLGFQGKLCVHPAQVELANAIFTPSARQIDTARRVIEGWQAALAQGRGVFALDGKMIDPPLVDVHERVLERARLAGALESS
jgi:citrate lyase beta subunit